MSSISNTHQYCGHFDASVWDSGFHGHFHGSIDMINWPLQTLKTTLRHVREQSPGTTLLDPDMYNIQGDLWYNEGNGVNFQSARKGDNPWTRLPCLKLHHCRGKKKLGWHSNDKTEKHYFVVSASYTWYDVHILDNGLAPVILFRFSRRNLWKFTPKIKGGWRSVKPAQRYSMSCLVGGMKAPAPVCWLPVLGGAPCDWLMATKWDEKQIERFP